MERREFLRRAAAGVGAAVVAGGLHGNVGAGEAPAPPPLERHREQPGMAYTRLGRTNLQVSRIVHGGLYTNREGIPVLARLYEAGVNFFDTSHVYGGGRSEMAFGEFFGRDGRRGNVFIATKMYLLPELNAGKGVYAKAMARADEALKRLQTDHVDIMMLHGCNTLLDHVDNPEWLRAAEDMKKQGKARYIGFSEHAKPAEVLRKAIACGRYDMAMVAFSFVKGTWPGQGRTDIPSIRPALEAARKADLGIVAMKAALRAEEMVAQVDEPKLKAQGYSPYQLCYRYVLDMPGVDAVVCGMGNMTHVEENIKVPGIRLSAGQVRYLERLAAARVCGFCGTCLDACPAGIAVQDILRFHGYWTHGHRAEARAEYAALPAPRRADACQDCGTCEAACPMRVAIRRRLREAHHALA